MNKIKLDMNDISVSFTNMGGTFQMFVEAVADVVTGRKETKLVQDVTPEQVHAIVTIATHTDGMPIGVDELYKQCESLFTDWPNYLRPIP